jgi:hypothetical protein
MTAPFFRKCPERLLLNVILIEGDWIIQHNADLFEK